MKICVYAGKSDQNEQPNEFKADEPKEKWTLSAVPKHMADDHCQQSNSNSRQAKGSRPSTPNDWCFLGFVAVCRCAVLCCHFTFHCRKPLCFASGQESSVTCHILDLADRRNERGRLLLLHYILERGMSNRNEGEALPLLFWVSQILSSSAI